MEPVRTRRPRRSVSWAPRWSERPPRSLLRLRPRRPPPLPARSPAQAAVGWLAGRPAARTSPAGWASARADWMATESTRARRHPPKDGWARAWVGFDRERRGVARSTRSAPLERRRSGGVLREPPPRAARSLRARAALRREAPAQEPPVRTADAPPRAKPRARARASARLRSTGPPIAGARATTAPLRGPVPQ